MHCIIVTKDSTVIVDGAGDATAVENRAAQLRRQLVRDDTTRRPAEHGDRTSEIVCSLGEEQTHVRVAIVDAADVLELVAEIPVEADTPDVLRRFRVVGP